MSSVEGIVLEWNSCFLGAALVRHLGRFAAAQKTMYGETPLQARALHADRANLRQTRIISQITRIHERSEEPR